MAKFVLKNPYTLVNGVDLSPFVKSVSFELMADEVDTTTASATGSKSRLVGLKDGKVSITFLQDYAASTVDPTLWGIWNAGNPVTVEVRADAAARSATNPAWSGSFILPNYSPLGGSVGQAVETQVEFLANGAPSRLTS